MKLTSDHESLAENKVMLLYILDKLDKPITNENLFSLVLSVQDLNYFYFQQFLLDLVNDAYVIGYTKEEETLYKITQEGKNTLELTIDLLPGIKKLKIDHVLTPQIDIAQNLPHATSEFFPRSENEFIVKCKLVQNMLTIFEIKLSSDSREQAKYIANQWESNHTEIYPIVMELLTKKNET